MKISELILQLQTLMVDGGDTDVFVRSAPNVFDEIILAASFLGDKHTNPAEFHYIVIPVEED